MLYEQKEIARLRRELRDAQDALDVVNRIFAIRFRYLLITE